MSLLYPLLLSEKLSLFLFPNVGQNYVHDQKAL